MESNTDWCALQGDNGDTSPMSDTKPAKMGESSPQFDGTAHTLRSGSVSLMEKPAGDGAERRPAKGLAISGVDVSTSGAPARPLPRALQPKDARRSPQPVSPPPGSVYNSGTRYGQLSAGINVSDSVLRQRSSSEFATSPTSSTRASAKPEVVLDRPEMERGGRRVLCEPNPGLATLRAAPLRHWVNETSRKPEVEMSSVNNRQQLKSFADRLAFFQSPCSTSSDLKSPGHTPSPTIYSRFNRNKFESDEPPTNVTAKPTSNLAVSMSSTALSLIHI